MIQDLRWVINFNGTRTLQAYDGYAWFEIKSISHTQESKEMAERMAIELNPENKATPAPLTKQGEA